MNIYLSGSMTSFGYEEYDKSNEWRIYFKDMIEELDNKTYVFNPNQYYNFREENYDSNKEILRYDLNKLRKSDLVIVNFNTSDGKQGSLGTMSEISIAFDRQIPILGLCENGEENSLHPWQEYFCDKIFTNREELLMYVINYYLN